MMMKLLMRFLSKEIAAIALVLLTGAGPALADSDEDGLRLRGIKIAYMDEARPLCFPAPDGEPQGLVVDLWRAWSKKTGIPVRLVLTSWEEAMQSTLDGRADVLGSLVKNKERESSFDFSRSLFKGKTVLIVRAGSGLEKDYFAREGVAGVIKESHGEKLHHELYPKGAIKVYDGQNEILRAFAQGEVDGVIAYLPHFSMYNKELENPVRYEVVAVLDESNLRVAVRKGEERLLKVIDKGFSLISGDEMKAIQNRWFVPDPAQDRTGSDWCWLCGVLLLAAIAILIVRLTRHPKH